jgi:hypothetical protein
MAQEKLMGASWRFFRFDADGAIERLSGSSFQRIWNGSVVIIDFRCGYVG